VSYGSGGSGPVSLAVGDVNGDGKPDLLVANQCSNRNNSNSCTGLLTVLLGSGDGKFQAAVSYASGGASPSSIVLADINGDEKPDVLISNQCARLDGDCAGNISVLLGKGDGSFPAAINYGSGGQTPYSVAVADVNGDGKADAAASSSSDVKSPRDIASGQASGKRQHQPVSLKKEDEQKPPSEKK